MIKRQSPELLLWSSLFLKLILSFFIPVFGDEAYYWFWGQNLQLSYFDHPGMVGWLTSLGSNFSFLPSQLLIRWPFILISTFSFLFFIKILKTLSKDHSTVFWISLFYITNPLLGLGGIFATPDVPLVFFWTLAFWLVLKIIDTQKNSFYILLGATLGLGLCSKYHIVLFPISIIISLALAKKLSVINPKKLIYTGILGFIFSLPVIIWNYQNEWSSFFFQLNHGFNGKNFSPLWSITYTLGQVLIFGPFLFHYSLKSFKNNFVTTSALAQWGFFLVSSLRATVEANWPITAHLQGYAGLQNINPKIKRWALVYIISIWLVGFVYMLSDFGKNKLKALPNSHSATEIWNKISSYSPIYGPTYQMSSLLHLVSGTRILKLNELSRFDFYDSGLFPKPKDKTFYVLKYDDSSWPDWLIEAEANFMKIEEFPDYQLSFYKVSHE